MFDVKLFGERLSELQQKAGLSQAAVGRLIGVTSTQANDMMRGKSATTMNRLYILCEYFHVSADYLLGLKDDPAP